MAYTIIPLKELRKDAVLPVAIYDGQNTNLMLLNRGNILTSDSLDTLHRSGISHVAIDSRYINAVWAAPKTGKTNLLLQQHFLAEQRKKADQKNQPLTRRLEKPQAAEYDNSLVASMQAKDEEHGESLKQFLDNIGDSKLVRGDAIKNVAFESIEHLLADVDLFVQTAINGVQTEMIHQHCLRVAKLAMSIATVLEFREEDVRHIGIGCMLSRVGIDPVIKDVMSKARELTPLEVLEIKKHPGRTWTALERITDLPVGARQVAWQINERWNGTGYPRGRAQKQIHPLARIAAVADVYIALTSPRPHRDAFAPHDALKQILSDTKRGLFEPCAVRGLLQTISLFPIGSCVELSNGTLAVTVRTDIDHYDRPTVKVVCDTFGNPLPECYLNLYENPELEIVATHSHSYLNLLIQRWDGYQEILGENGKYQQELASR